MNTSFPFRVDAIDDYCKGVTGSAGGTVRQSEHRKT